MNIKKARMPPEFNNKRLFWAFDHTKQDMESSIKFQEVNTDVLEDLRESESLENIPDPLTNVLGVTFEPVELLKIDRSLSPITGRSHNKNGAQTTRANIKIRDLSNENNTLREKRSGKDKYKNYGTGKYSRYSGRNTGNPPTSIPQWGTPTPPYPLQILGLFNHSLHHPQFPIQAHQLTLPLERSHQNEYPIKSRTNRDRVSERDQKGRSSNYRGSSRTNNNKFSLNLSAVRKVSIQTKYLPTSGRERNSKEKLTAKDGIMSDRWRGNSRNSGTMMGNLTDRRYYRDRDNDDTYNSILSHYKRKSELNNSVGFRAATARSKR